MDLIKGNTFYAFENCAVLSSLIHYEVNFLAFFARNNFRTRSVFHLMAKKLWLKKFGGLLPAPFIVLGKIGKKYR